MTNVSELGEVGSAKFIHLTSTGRKTGKPHTVELWFAVNDGRVYLSHEGEETDWMRNIKKNPKVIFEIGKKDFTGAARYLNDLENEAWTAKVALYEKYYGKASKETIEDWFSLSKLILVDGVRPAPEKGG